MATTQHYLWASGHFILLISSFRHLLAWLTFKSVSTWWYKASFTGALISYAIVCQKSLGNPKPSFAYLKKALLDENVQYFLLAMFWWSSKPVTVALLPYAVFSLFHALTFARTTLMPQFLPPGPPATSGGAPQPHPLAKRLQAWIKANYDSAMRIVAYTELVIFVRIVLGTLTFQNPLISPLIYGHFLRQRYYQSAFTRDVVASTVARIDDYVRKPGSPPILKQVWDRIRIWTERWVGGGYLVPNTDGVASPRH